MVHHQMGGKYKTRGKCGGSGHGGLDNLDSSPQTQERSRYAKKSIFLYLLMKFLSGKAMEKISTIFVYDIPTYKKYFQK